MMKKFLLHCVLSLAVFLASCSPAAVSPTPDDAALEPTASAESTVTAESSAETLPAFEETACPFELPEGAPVECGFVVVPEDHANPDGPSIRLATIIVRDQSENHKPDPVILLAGGPGERAVASTLQIAPSLAPLHPNRD
ncbi:MAG: hypothetical protein ACK2TX_10665, partial [Anaerolineales bacterium]